MPQTNPAWPLRLGGVFCWVGRQRLTARVLVLLEPLQQLGITNDHIALTVLPHVGQATIFINP